jgi:hypothetical protein
MNEQIQTKYKGASQRERQRPIHVRANANGHDQSRKLSPTQPKCNKSVCVSVQSIQRIQQRRHASDVVPRETMRLDFQWITAGRYQRACSSRLRDGHKARRPQSMLAVRPRMFSGRRVRGKAGCETDKDCERRMAKNHFERTTSGSTCTTTGSISQFRRREIESLNRIRFSQGDFVPLIEPYTDTSIDLTMGCVFDD